MGTGRPKVVALANRAHLVRLWLAGTGQKIGLLAPHRAPNPTPPPLRGFHRQKGFGECAGVIPGLPTSLSIPIFSPLTQIPAPVNTLTPKVGHRHRRRAAQCDESSRGEGFVGRAGGLTRRGMLTLFPDAISPSVKDRAKRRIVGRP